MPKKSATANAAGAEETAAWASVTEQYETMRMAALGEQLPLEARSGLALLLRRGLWAWAQAAAAPSTTPRPTQSPPPVIADEEQRAVVHLFAAMAMRPPTPRTKDP